MATMDTTPGRRSSALSEPVRPVSRRWVTKWTFALFGISLAYFSTQQILLPRHANAIAGGDSAVAIAITSYAGVAAAVVAIIVSILVGTLSDRTLHSRGRRQIWVIGGAGLAAVAFLLQGLQTSAVGLVGMWMVFQVGYNAAFTALLAAIPDEVPVNERATVSGFLVLGQSIGPLAGMALIGFVLTGIVNAYVGLAIFMVLLTIPFALGTRGVPLDREQRSPLRIKTALIGIIAPLRHADFAWAFGQRCMIGLSNAFGVLFLYQYLRDAVGTNPETGTLILSLIYTTATCAVSVPCGRISDRTLKRKRMVVISSILCGAAGITMAFWHTLPSAMIAAAILGTGFSCYLSVDQALITQVLPRAEDRGKDLGVIQLANVLPYIVGSALGGLLINSFGGFTTLYLSMVVTGLAAAAFVMPIKAVR
ncbi:MFS transporter [Amycolatopsis sp. H20-H5]|uniref:MFS transporter n=1 Tax=Amycolatopsis sp. H20-H5 TaxID=3046309 RepID=UPI002DBBCBE1|nr:MFS transporter [Amycolatopsis sp. H20-H5]